MIVETKETVFDLSKYFVFGSPITVEQTRANGSYFGKGYDIDSSIPFLRSLSISFNESLKTYSSFGIYS